MVGIQSERELSADCQIFFPIHVENNVYLCKMFMTKEEHPYIVAGPCSVESREQLREVSMELRNIKQVRLIRGGVWKPRTRPGGFEGLGEPALEWMGELQRELGVRYCCEVARPEQVELCQQHGIGTVWIGARTTANPFMVSELCTALRNSGMQVMVKNPVCPDVSLWLGAIERVHSAGIDDITAVHRGFSMYHNQGYRNAPLWELVMELRREAPGVPLLCDPSHIGGRRELVRPLCDTARQMAFDGLMVEVHPHPDEAWTDAAQQITAAELQAIVKTWLPDNTGTTPKDNGLLAPLRDKIDDVDREMLALLRSRMGLARQIACVKREQGMPVYQPQRWDAVMSDRLRQAESLGLDKAFVRELLEKIHAESVRVQLNSSAD